MDYKENVKIKISSEKSFGIIFSIFFFVLSIYPLFIQKNFNYILFIISIILILTSFIYSSVLKYPNFLWFKFGELIGKVISPLVMLSIYLIVFFPIGLFYKLLNKDLLGLKIDKNKHSYWSDKKYIKSSMRNQF